MIYEKIITQNEKEILSLLDEMGLSSITVPYKIVGDRLIMQKAQSLPDIGKAAIDIPRLYRQCLSSLYKYSNTTFSCGIYGIFRSKNNICTETNYFLYLKNEVDRISNELKNYLNPELVLIYKNAINFFEIGLENYRDYFEKKTHFELLHGDLFSGNILLYDNKYVLIDFEYMRFGPKLSEISFLLLWDIITIPRLNKKASLLDDDIDKLRNNNIITDEEKMVLKKVYIPLYIALICLYVSAERYRDCEIISKGVVAFFKNYYGNMRCE